MRVCVIGAGFAGLLAARSLAERGIEPVVLEARSRVGGRVFSQQLPNDAVAERGAEFAEAGSSDGRHGGGAAWPRAGADRRAQRRARASRRHRRHPAVGARPGCQLQEQLAEGGVELAGRSAAEVLAKLVPDPGVRQALEARLQVTWARPVEQLAASVLERIPATFSPSSVPARSWPPGRTIPGPAAPIRRARHGGGRRTRSCWPDPSAACTSPASTPPASGQA
jgi:glycine/D-amino acid oxidase-like deaminating enzyme